MLELLKIKKKNMIWEKILIEIEIKKVKLKII